MLLWEAIIASAFLMDVKSIVAVFGASLLRERQ